jgi:hypothetical protein
MRWVAIYVFCNDQPMLEAFMRFYTLSAAAVALGLMAVAPALAQTKPDTSQPQQTAAKQQNTLPASSGNAMSSPADPTKQETQGLPAGTDPPQYGTDWARKIEKTQ